MSAQAADASGQGGSSPGGDEMPPLCVTIKQACRLMSIGRSTFFKLEKDDRIAVRRLGTKVLVPMASIHEFVANLPSTRSAGPKTGR